MSDEHPLDTAAPAAVARYLKFLVFRIGDRKYALPAEQVREIVLDLALFPLPFAPPYVRGLINRLGEPYAALDLRLMFEDQKLEAATYIILSLADDQIALLITDVVEIVRVPEDTVHGITSEDTHEGYFVGSITTGEDEVFVVNVRTVAARLRNDAEGT